MKRKDKLIKVNSYCWLLPAHAQKENETVPVHPWNLLISMLDALNLKIGILKFRHPKLFYILLLSASRTICQLLPYSAFSQLHLISAFFVWK